MTKLLIYFISITILLLSLPAVAQTAAPDGTLAEHLEAAQHYMQAQQWDYASYEWRTVLAQDPKNLPALLGLGEALCRSGLVSEAIHQLEQARLQLPANVQKSDLELALASAYVQGNKPEQARHLYEGILRREPYSNVAFRGLVSLKAKLPAQQRDALQQFLSQKSQQAKAEWKKSMKASQYLDAARHFEMVAIYNPIPPVLNDYGLSLLMAGKFQVANKVFNVLKRQDDSWRTHANAAVAALSLGNTYSAQQEMELAIASASEPTVRARLYNNLGYIYESARKSTKARFAYERAVSLQPEFTKARMNLGYIYQKDRDFEQAVALYHGLTQREAKNVEAWNQLGFSYELQHKDKQAIASYKEAIRLDPGYKAAYYNLGTLYRKLNKVNQASEAFKKMTDIEFNEIENLKKKSSQVTPEPELFKYIDLFLVERL